MWGGVILEKASNHWMDGDFHVPIIILINSFNYTSIFDTWVVNFFESRYLAFFHSYILTSWIYTVFYKSFTRRRTLSSIIIFERSHLASALTIILINLTKNIFLKFCNFWGTNYIAIAWFLSPYPHFYSSLLWYIDIMALFFPFCSQVRILMLMFIDSNNFSCPSFSYFPKL